MVGWFETYSARMPLWVLIGGLLGIGCGVFFGELTAPLEDVNAVYTALMQVAAIPYLVSSILHGLGSETRERFMRILKQFGSAYLIVLLVTFALLAVIVIQLSDTAAPALVRADETQSAASLIDRIIPTNIFSAVAQNYLPATIVFSILFGIAMQTSRDKQAMIDLLKTVKSSSVKIWEWVVLFAPLAVFSVCAHLVGVTPLDTLVSVSIYFIAIVSGTLVLAFAILPLLLNTLYAGAFQKIWPDLRNGLLIAMTTSLSVAALPFIQRAVMKFLDAVGAPSDGNRGAVTETTLSLSYPMAQLGNFFIWVFIAFSFTYFRDSVSFFDQMILPVMVLLSAIGSPSTSVDAVAFLAGWLALPSQSVDLYSGTFVVTRYFQVLASVMGFAATAMLTTIFYYRLAQPVSTLSMAKFGLIVACIVGVGALMALPPNSTPRGSFADYMQMTVAEESASAPAHAIPQTTAPPSTTPDATTTTAATTSTSVLDRIQRSGVLRVGYNPTTIPFTYDNAAGDPVGFDIEYARALAASLNVRLELIPFQWTSLDSLLESGSIDIAAAGIYVTDDRLERFLVSNPYYESALALIVKSDRYQDFLSRQDILANAGGEITVFNDPTMVHIAQNLFPDVTVNTVKNYYEGEDFSLAIWTEDQAWAFALTDRTYTAILPRDLGGSLLFAYLIPDNGHGLHRYVNYWLRLQRESGFHDRMVEKWIKADPNLDRPPRWSILRNVLGVNVD